MEDPVILPSSKVSIDRATIRSHLLSDPNDPFNRAPLKIEDVKPGRIMKLSFLIYIIGILQVLTFAIRFSSIIDTELKAKIEAFKAERKAAKLVAITAAALDGMDTSGG